MQLASVVVRLGKNAWIECFPMLQLYPYNKRTVLLPVRVTRVTGLQAALELGIPIVAILTDGLLLEFSAERDRLKKEIWLFRGRVHLIASSTALQWHAEKWVQEGFSLRKLRPGARNPGKHIRRWRSDRPRVVIHSRHMVY